MLAISMAMVIGPTPPGTGVMAPALFGGFVIGDVADEPRLALALLGRRDAVDADIDDGRAGLDPVALDHLRPADGGDEDVGRAAERGQDPSCANVAMVTVQLAASSRLAIGLPTMLERPTTTALRPDRSRPRIALDQEHRAGRRAGHEGRVDLAGAELADIDEVEAVDVLFRRDRLDDLAGIDVAGQRKLDQDAVDRGIGVELLDQREKIGLARCRRAACAGRNGSRIPSPSSPWTTT